MGSESKIEWTDHTFNPWWGCVEVSPGCAHCYAKTFAKRVGQKVWGAQAERRLFGESHWNEPRKWNAAAQKASVRAKVFCASMADVFEDFAGHTQQAELEAARARLFALIAETPWLDWLLLTKRPQNMERLAPESWGAGWPANVWAGTTVEDQKRADERIPHLLRVPARVRFLSVEPMLGPVDLDGAFATREAWGGCSRCGLPWSYRDDREPVCRDVDGHICPVGYGGAVSWVIVGGESGPGARPMHPAWARGVRDQCVAAGVPFFFKQWGEHRDLIRLGKRLAGRELDGRTWDEMPGADRA